MRALFIICLAVVQANAMATADAAQAKFDAVFNICESVVPVGHSDFSALNNVTIYGAAMAFFQARSVSLDDNEPSNITLLEGPLHGELRNVFYYPNEGYLGSDQMTYSLEVKGKIFKVVYSVYVNRSSEYIAPECGDNYAIKEVTNSDRDISKGKK